MHAGIASKHIKRHKKMTKKRLTLHTQNERATPAIEQKIRLVVHGPPASFPLATVATAVVIIIIIIVVHVVPRA